MITGNFRYPELLDNLGIGMVFISRRMEIIFLNRVMKRWFPDIDVTKKNICYKVFNDPPKRRICRYCPVVKTFSDGRVHEVVTQTPARGRVVNYRAISSPLRDDSGRIIAAVEIIEDVTDVRRLQERLKTSEEKYRKLFTGANDPILIADAKSGRILDANKRAEEMLGRTKERICRMRHLQIYPKEESARYRELFGGRARKGKVVDFEAEMVGRNGKRTPVFISTSAQEIEGRKVIQSIFRDVSRLKQIEKEKKEAEALALIDPHTRLYNYRYLQRRLRSEFEAAKRYARPLSLFITDIDYFNSINDVYGHEFGDAVLEEFASLLQRNSRGVDVVTRCGGEEFAIMLPDTNGSGALAFAQRIQSAINGHRFGKFKTRLKASIGIAFYPELGVATAEALLNNAYKAVRVAKEKGGNTIYTWKARRRAPAFGAVPKKRARHMNRRLAELVRKNNLNIIEAVYALAQTVGVKDAYMEQHSHDMVFYATHIGRRLKLSEAELEDLRHGAMLHDIGKIGISDSILLKRGRLTKDEFKEIQRHPQIGADIIRSVHFLRDVVPLILYHHERYDGHGYGAKLKGEDIPLGARIIGLVDAYQALISDRPYRSAYSKKEACRIIKEEAGRHFDPALVKIFLEVLRGREKRG